MRNQSAGYAAIGIPELIAQYSGNKSQMRIILIAMVSMIPSPIPKSHSLLRMIPNWNLDRTGSHMGEPARWAKGRSVFHNGAGVPPPVGPGIPG